MKITALLYPPICRSCGVFIPSSEVFCFDCEDKIQPLPSCTIEYKKNQTMKLYAVSNYCNPLRRLILCKNRPMYSFPDRLSSRLLARVLCQKILSGRTPPVGGIIPLLSMFNFDAVVPIPLHWTRYARRGFNQSYEMAKVIGKFIDVPVLSILKRTRRTEFQAELSSKMRQQNVKHVFETKRKYRGNLEKKVGGKHILLVDDLCTTGATLKNAAKIIDKANPKKISAIVACRVVSAGA